MNFENIKFCGKFRSYQQRVLDNSASFLKDNKINIVAAPGSGKTILGLELIRRLGNPCIVLSPTTTIRQQWGDRFESFLPANGNVNAYVSYDLNKVSLITSVTYQALYSAIEKIATSSEEEEIDYSNVEMFSLMKRHGIKTVCLDEAHHLQNEWQKALEKFIKGLDKDVTVISLTATPPYDAGQTEWGRYVSVCGEIDDEIFVPELVKENTLCPHQDYVIFNYPSEKEKESFSAYRRNVNAAISAVAKLDFMRDMGQRISSMYRNSEEYIYKNFSQVVALMVYLNWANLDVDKKLFCRLTNSKVIPNSDAVFAEKAVQFLISSEITSDAEKEQLVSLLKKLGVYDKRKVNFDLTDKLRRELVSSCGKLTSIQKIVRSECASLQNKLRMLVLTDYIKKESVANIGKDVAMDNISVVSIFETIRKDNPTAKVACLSGSLIILPKSVLPQMAQYGFGGDKLRCTDLADTGFVNVTLKCQNRDKVSVISKLFERGEIQILVGTQSLLGEGWDSPCINSLILASYVGSFMLSNQMRGRAIRTYKNDPQKTANIWHLVTLEPQKVLSDNTASQEVNTQNIQSYDYNTLCRRFECFVGPNYDTGEIESGIERITYIKPPYTLGNVQKINEKMFAQSRNRDGLRETWQKEVAGNGTKTYVQTDVPKECRVPAFTFTNLSALIICALLQGVFSALLAILGSLIQNPNLRFAAVMAIAVAMVVVVLVMYKLLLFVLRHCTPQRSVKSLSQAVLKTLKDLNLVNGTATLRVFGNANQVEVSVHGATIHEQNLFNTAVKELLSPIENPRYVIVAQRRKGYNYRMSFACPSVIGKTEEGVTTMKKHLKSVGKVAIVYAYSESGKKLAFKCRKHSFITRNQQLLKTKYKVSKYE